MISLKLLVKILSYLVFIGVFFGIFSKELLDDRIGDIIIVSVKDAIPRSKVKKGEVQRAIIVRTKKPLIRDENVKIFANA